MSTGDSAVEVDPARIHSLATTLSNAGDAIGDVTTGQHTAELSADLNGTSVAPACSDGARAAAAVITALGTRMTDKSSTVTTSAHKYEQTDSDNKAKIDTAGEDLP